MPTQPCYACGWQVWLIGNHNCEERQMKSQRTNLTTENTPEAHRRYTVDDQPEPCLCHCHSTGYCDGCGDMTGETIAA